MDFVRKKTLRAEIARLNEELALERKKNAAQTRELTQLREKQNGDVRIFQEMREAMQTRLQDLDDRRAQFEKQKEEELAQLRQDRAQARQDMEAERACAREALEQELEQARQCCRKELEERLRSFQAVYSGYLARTQAAMDSISRAALQAGAELFAEEAPDVAGIFRAETSGLEEAPARPAIARGSSFESIRPAGVVKDAHVERVADILDTLSREEAGNREALVP